MAWRRNRAFRPVPAFQPLTYAPPLPYPYQPSHQTQHNRPYIRPILRGARRIMPFQMRPRRYLHQQQQYMPAQPPYPNLDPMQPLSYGSMIRQQRRMTRMYVSPARYPEPPRVLWNGPRIAPPTMRQQRRASRMLEQQLQVPMVILPPNQPIQMEEPYYLMSGREVDRVLHSHRKPGDAFRQAHPTESRKARNRNSRIIGPSGGALRSQDSGWSDERNAPVDSDRQKLARSQSSSAPSLGVRHQLLGPTSIARSASTSAVPQRNRLNTRNLTSVTRPPLPALKTAPSTIPFRKTLESTPRPSPPALTAKVVSKTPPLKRLVSAPPARLKTIAANATNVKPPKPDMPASTRLVPASTTLKSVFERSTSAPSVNTKSSASKFTPPPLPVPQASSLPAKLPPTLLPLPGAPSTASSSFSPQEGDYVTILSTGHSGLVHNVRKPIFLNSYKGTEVFDMQAGGKEWYDATKQLGPAKEEMRNMKKPPAEGRPMRVQGFDQTMLLPFSVAV